MEDILDPKYRYLQKLHLCVYERCLWMDTLFDLNVYFPFQVLKS